MILLKIYHIFGLSIEVYLINLIIGIPVFFLLRWLIRKLIKNNKLHRLISWVTTIILTPIIYLGLIVLWISISSYYPNIIFDKTKWDTDKDKRYEMSDEIIKSKMLIGKTKQEVIKRLGNGGNDLDNNDWYYDLGFIQSQGTTLPSTLTVKFMYGKVIVVEYNETE